MRGMKLEPANVALIGGELAIAWNDGKESYIPLARLRAACPCARCQGEPDVLGRTIPLGEPDPDPSLELLGWNAVGGYALQPIWEDGHSSGLFTYTLLRELGEG
jgi:DUF971 family protein